ncbi:MAG: DNRLRE domain-containing protein, partial [Minicystis sp.]
MLGEARQAATNPTCITIRRLSPTKAWDTFVNSEKKSINYGANTLANTSGAVDANTRALFKFDLAPIPANATILSAGLTLNQTNNGLATSHIHLITAAWDEATVTWNSLGNSFGPAFAAASNANAAQLFVVGPQVQAWVNGTTVNNGFLIDQIEPSITRYKTAEFVLAPPRPALSVCYQVTCAPSFADCNGIAADGCETNLHSLATCGSCGNVCPPLPHATAGCGGGACAIGACDLGWGNCDGILQNGCETDLSTSSDCSACGGFCSLPGSVASCASGTCKLVTCAPGFANCDGNAVNGCEAGPCANGAHCAAAADCGSQVCVGGFCSSPACNDHAKNGSETDMDCGGPSCAPCADTKQCGAGGDCQSGICLGGICHAAGCSDGLKNGGETGVDCGGICSPCANGAPCLVAADCQSSVCIGGVCQIPSCTDAVKNGTESDVDCGGSCTPCNDNALCVGAGDCVDGVCANGHCQPATCADGVKNGNETGVDCGGACASPEVCDGKDNDCNGSVDDGLGSTSCGVGACQVTVQNCVGGVPQGCVPGQPIAEVCDGLLDDDCDGVVDDGCECVNGATQGCYSGSGATAGVGLCHGGTQTCVLGHWGSCAGEATPAQETCDGADNDCDGQTDEDLGSTICGVGACQVMVQNCVAGVVASCVPGAPGPEICDGQDNNCDGQVDEGQPTQVCGSGACASSQPTCVNGAPAACNAQLLDGTACSDGHDCTLNDACQAGTCAGSVAPSGMLCRASTGACDPAETCTGGSLDCPADAK